MKERTVKTVVSNVALILVLATVAVYRPAEPLLYAGVSALLIINGYEALQRAGDDREGGL